jgi:hypothetical protein
MDVGRGPLRVVSAAEAAGFYTVVTTGRGSFKDRPETTSVVVRGWSGRRKFAALWYDGKASGGYWWTREHHAVASLPTESVEWTTEQPLPAPVSVTELLALLRTA